MAEPWPAFAFVGERCTGCEACRIACGIANGDGRDNGWRQVLTFNPRRHPAFPTRHLSLACNHCDTPACMLGCPAAAYRRDDVTGAVLLDQERCIGCRYCSWVCPYDAPRFQASRGVMSKCTFCVERLMAGGLPACIQACPTGALALCERSATGGDPEYVGVAKTGLGPALTVAPARPWRVDIAPSPPPTSLPPIQPEPVRKIRPAGEWTLVLFTVVLPVLVGWFGAGVLRADRIPHPLPFLAIGAVAMALSALHLGRPQRAWRALLNLRSSRLSREILLSGSFLGLAAATLLGGRGSPAAPWIVLVVGAGSLLAVDRIYAVIPRRAAAPPHSSGALLTGALVLGLVGGGPALAWGAALAKLALHAWRRARRHDPLPVELALLRWTLLLAAAATSSAWPVAITLAAAGELIDRSAFYADLEPVSPASTMGAAAALS